MAVTAVTKNTLVRNAGTAITETTLESMTGTDGFSIAAVDNCDKFFLTFDNTSAPDQTVTINASDYFTLKGQGDLTLTLEQNTVQGVVLEAARFRQEDGSITGSITDSATGATGICIAAMMP